MDQKGLEKIIARCIPMMVIIGLLLVPLATGNIGTAWADVKWRATPCTIDNIAAIEDRIHVKCTTAEPDNLLYTVYYYAVSTVSGPASSANRMLALLNTAYAMTRPVSIMYDTASANNPAGCAASDCRKMLAVLLD